MHQLGCAVCLGIDWVLQDVAICSGVVISLMLKHSCLSSAALGSVLDVHVLFRNLAFKTQEISAGLLDAVQHPWLWHRDKVWLRVVAWHALHLICIIPVQNPAGCAPLNWLHTAACNMTRFERNQHMRVSRCASNLGAPPVHPHAGLSNACLNQPPLLQ